MTRNLRIFSTNRPGWLSASFDIYGPVYYQIAKHADRMGKSVPELIEAAIDHLAAEHAADVEVREHDRALHEQVPYAAQKADDREARHAVIHEQWNAGVRNYSEIARHPKVKMTPAGVRLIVLAAVKQGLLEAPPAKPRTSRK